MNQTSVIFFGLLVGFIVFITVRGELALYLDVVGLGNNDIDRATASRLNDALAPLKVTLPRT